MSTMSTDTDIVMSTTGATGTGMANATNAPVGGPAPIIVNGNVIAALPTGGFGITLTRSIAVGVEIETIQG